MRASDWTATGDPSPIREQRSPVRPRGVWLVGALVLALLLAGATRSPGDTGNDTRRRVGVWGTPDMFAGVNIDDAQAAIQVWTRALTQRMSLKYRPEVTVAQDSASLAAAVRAGQVDVVGLSGLAYLEMRDRIGLEPVVVGTWGEERRATEEYVLLARRDGGLENLEALQGQAVILAAADQGRMAMVWLDVLLWRAGLPESRKFLSIRTVERPSQAVLPVFFGQADACVVTDRAWQTMGELNPQVTRELRQLARSPALLLRVMCLRRESDPALRQEMLNASLQLHKETEGRQILEIFRLNQVVPFQPVFLEGLESLMAEYRTLSAQRSEGR